MSPEQIAQSLREQQARGIYFPPEWTGKLGIERAYPVQLANLAHKLAGGERQAGWKVGLTAGHMREMFNSPDPVFGHLLESARKDSGHRFAWPTLRKPAVESELLITLARDLSGPSATTEDARAAIASVAPALEIVEMGRADMRTDIALAIADNVSQYAFVHGTPIPLGELDFGSVRARVEINGEVAADVVGHEVIDNQLQTLAWLANALHGHGRRLRAGDRIMTGSFTKPLPLQAGSGVRTSFAGIGTVEAWFD